MEQRKVQRTVGMIVVVALVTVVGALLFEQNRFSIQEATNVKAPPFRDQSQSQPQLTETAPITQNAVNPPSEKTADNGTLPVPPALSAQAPKLANETSPAAPAPAEPTPDVGTIVYEPVPATTSPTSTPVAASAPVATPTPPPAVISPVVEKEKSVHPALNKTVRTKTKIISLKNKIRSPAWVVQMGNFGVKKNAANLTNLLRAAGYKTFTREVKSHSGKINTRVYIGPELKQASAVKLSNEVHHKLNLQGLVVSYIR